MQGFSCYSVEQKDVTVGCMCHAVFLTMVTLGAHSVSIDRAAIMSQGVIPEAGGKAKTR